jgi:coenzyme F420-reducing hydrogenase beta subunit
MSREAAVDALAALVQNAYPWASPVGRRLVLAEEVAASAMPICYVFVGGFHSYERSHSGVPKRTLQIKLYVYTACPDNVTSDAPVQNAIMDALDAALDDVARGRQTLGNSVYTCQIDGNVLQVPGDLDGTGMLVIPIKLIIP